MKKNVLKNFLYALCLLVITLFISRIGLNFMFGMACVNQNVGLMKLTLALGANIEEREDDRTKLIYAVEANEIQNVKILLELGANPNAGYSGGATALEIAEGEEFTEMANLLLKYGAKPKLRRNVTKRD